MYGSTEHPSITGCTYSDSLEKASVHRWTTVARQRDQAGGSPTDVRLHPGSRVRFFLGDPNASGLHRPGAHREGVRPGWLVPHRRRRRARPDGYLSITDRISDIIIRGGENISAAEVEEVLMTLAGVAEVAVVAAPDNRMGEHAARFLRMVDGSMAPDLAGCGITSGPPVSPARSGQKSCTRLTNSPVPHRARSRSTYSATAFASQGTEAGTTRCHPRYRTRLLRRWMRPG